MPTASVIVTCRAEAAKHELISPFDHGRVVHISHVGDLLIVVRHRHFRPIIQDRRHILVDLICAQRVILSQQVFVLALELEELV